MAKNKDKTKLPAKPESAAQISLQVREPEPDAKSILQRDAGKPPVQAEAGTNGSTSAAPATPKRIRRRKAIGIGKALRQRGFDEHTIAENYIGVTERLKSRSDKNGSAEKLLVDVMKECSKYIEPQKLADRWSDRSNRTPIHIHLVHNVSRPERLGREPARELVIDLAHQAPPGAEPENNLGSVALPEADSRADGDECGDARGALDVAARERS